MLNYTFPTCAGPYNAMKIWFQFASVFQSPESDEFGEFCGLTPKFCLEESGALKCAFASLFRKILLAPHQKGLLISENLHVNLARRAPRNRLYKCAHLGFFRINRAKIALQRHFMKLRLCLNRMQSMRRPLLIIELRLSLEKGPSLNRYKRGLEDKRSCCRRLSRGNLSLLSRYICNWQGQVMRISRKDCRMVIWRVLWLRSFSDGTGSIICRIAMKSMRRL